MRFFQICLILLLPLSIFAQKQTFEQYKTAQQTKYQNVKSAKQKDYDAYRRKINAEYAKTMAQKWTLYKSYAAIKKPKDQDPPQPAVKIDKTPPPINEIQYQSVGFIPPHKLPEPVVPIDESSAEGTSEFRFMFYGTPCAVHLNDALKYTLRGYLEPDAMKMWEHLSAPAYDALITDCLRLRSKLQLADWGYINLVRTFTQKFFGPHSNEAVLMQMYILTQSGYDIRIARTGENWVLLVPFQEDIYSYSYLSRDDKAYYILDKIEGNSGYYVFDKAFPNEQMPSLQMTQSPRLAYSAMPQRTLVSRRFPNLKITISENKNLIDFYNDYPLSSKWDFYSAASLSEETKRTLYPILRREIAGKSTYDAANMLINFVQTAFDYQTDGDQFGYERPLFGDETFYYPYSDCEDRSILYAILVRELLGLETVLLNYPGHLATAVHFPDNTAHGWHFRWEDRVYTICDPTYIGADAGDCMTQFQTVAPKIVPIQ